VIGVRSAPRWWFWSHDIEPHQVADLDMPGMRLRRLVSYRRGAEATELFYTGDRNTAADYLKAHGWRVDIRTTAQVYAANGFKVPDDELASFGDASGYLTATLA
jgi:O-methyltransferase involved in polyketide biosynthesis